MSINSRQNFNFRILAKSGNTLTLRVMIINEEQHSFYISDTFFFPAFRSAIEQYPMLKSKPYFKLVTEKRANKDAIWAMRNLQVVFPEVSLVSLKNLPLLFDPSKFDLKEWEDIWEQRKSLPQATYKVVFADHNLLDGFEEGMDWDSGVVPLLGEGYQLEY